MTTAQAAHGPIAVIDVETTGLFPKRHDRVIEIAAVVISAHGLVEREFVTLVNPQRDIGPTHIHGLTSADVIGAPTFEEIAGALTDTLKGVVAIAAHNARFDHAFLAAEFNRAGIELPLGLPTLCTMALAGGGSLNACCDCYGLERDPNGHHALDDARSAAKLLSHLLNDAFDERKTPQSNEPRPVARPPPLHTSSDLAKSVTITSEPAPLLPTTPRHGPARSRRPAGNRGRKDGLRRSAGTHPRRSTHHPRRG